MTNASAAAVAAAIRARTSFIITSHARPDGDAIGSSVAMALALDALGKRSRVVLKDPVPAPYAAFPALEDAGWHAIRDAIRGACSPAEAVRRIQVQAEEEIFA